MLSRLLRILLVDLYASAVMGSLAIKVLEIIHSKLSAARKKKLPALQQFRRCSFSREVQLIISFADGVFNEWPVLSK